MAIAANDWLRLSRLLDTALSLAPSERLSWVDSLDAEHAPLQGVLRELLNRDDLVETRGFLGTLPKVTGELSPRLAGAAVGDTIGPYVLERELGSGGMASVWLAQRTDGLLKRKVALKLPHVGGALAGLAERMARERNILAALEHPHIARLYDAGIAGDGRPYLALEYVEGEPIDQYCERHAVDLPGRIRFVVQVARAVAYAHAHLVVHRDLKPSNIQVDAEGQVHLLDFGIAKLLDERADDQAAPLTRIAGTALTPEYASPEQIRGDAVSTASDVYSIGVVVYELLTGTPLHRLRGVAARAGDAIEYPRPSEQVTSPALKRQLRGDLDTIVLKALKHEPAERYATMAEFADDLERHLRGEPVRARPDGTWYRVRKFVGRHSLGVSAAAIAILALLGALGLAAWQAREAAQQALTAQREATRARAVQGFLTDLFNTNTDAQDDPVHARQLTARELLDRGAARVGESLRDSPEAKDEVLGTLSDMYRAVGSDDEASALDKQRVDVRKRLYGDRDPRVAEALITYAQNVGPTVDRLEAAHALAQARKILDVAPNADPMMRVRLLQETARDEMYTAVTSMRDDAHAAAAVIEKAGLRTFEYASILRLEARANTWLGRWTDSAVLFERSRAENRKFAPAGFDLELTDVVELADLEVRMAHIPAAERLYRDVLKESQRRNGIAHVDTIQVETRLAAFLHNTSRLAESREVMASALRHATGEKGVDTPNLIRPLQQSQVGALLDEGQIEAAAPLVAKAVDMDKQLYPDSTTLASALYDVGRLNLALGHYEEAEHAIDEGWRMLRTGLGPARLPISDDRFLLQHAAVLVSTGRSRQAIDELGAIVGMKAPAGVALFVDRVSAREWMAAAYLQLGDNARALAEASGALDELRRSSVRQYYQKLEADGELRVGEAQLRLQNPQAARAALEHALSLYEANVDANGPVIEDVSLVLADAMIQLREPARARELQARAASVRAAHAKQGVELPQPLLKGKSQL